LNGWIRGLRRRGVAATIALGVAALLAVAVDSREIHSSGATSPGVDISHAPRSVLPPPNSRAEARLRAVETRVLGPAHAAQHAMARREQLPDGNRRSQGAPALRGGSGTPSAIAAAAPEPAAVGRWIPKFSIPSVAVHAVMLPTGKVLYFTGPDIGHAYLLDPVTQTTENVDPPSLPGQTSPANIFCAGQSLLADGRVLIVGGTVTRRVGARTIFTFDPFTKTWARHPDMRHGRWYPSQLLLADGRTAILDGLDERGEPFTNPDIEVYDTSVDTVSVAAVRGMTGQPPAGGLYPHLFLMPSGRALVAGPQREDSWFFESSPGAGLTWEDAPNLTTRRSWASGVLMPGGAQGSSTVELIGGADKDALPDSGTSTPLASTETFDERNVSAGWTPGPSLNVARAHHNTVLLPDGSMVTVGGGYGILNGNRRTGDLATQRQIELYDPASNSWRLGPSEDELRTYHSTALLLRDGRVLSAGDDVNGGSDVDTAEIYEPPYLFKGPRPAIESAPDTIGIASTFTVSTKDQVSRAVLMAPGAVTHANDMGQRSVQLQVAQRTDGEGVDLVGPKSPNIAPPGYYMLFLLNDSGVPSVAKFVRLRMPPKPATIDIAPPAPLTHEDVTLTAAAAPGGVPISGVEWDIDGDGSFDDGASNPVTTAFGSPGPHVIRVRRTDDAGASTVSERTLTVGNRPPTATIGFSPPSPVSLDSVSFTASTGDPDSAIATVLWDLDDDGAFDDGSGPNALGQFPRKGSYVARVLVTDELGASITASVTVIVANRSPAATFEHAPAQPVPLEVVTFTSTSSDLDGAVTSVEWDTDDDGSFDDAAGGTATRTYPASGEFTVRLRVTDNDGDQAVGAQSITIRADSAPIGPLTGFEQPIGGIQSGTNGAATQQLPLTATLSKELARSKARRALRRRYGRRYKRATSKVLSCKRRSATALRCRYKFRSKGERIGGTVEVVQNGTRVTARVQPSART
jgi:hypothetical protein